MSLKESLIDQLLRDEEFRLFLKSHYVVEVETSYIPLLSGDKLYFKSDLVVVRKKLNILDKLKYYLLDLKLFLRGDRSVSKESKGSESKTG